MYFICTKKVLKSYNITIHQIKNMLPVHYTPLDSINRDIPWIFVARNEFIFKYIGMQII